MLERFSDGAREVLVLAEAEARRLSHDQIGTEHLLLGLIREKNGVAARVLHNLGVDLNQIRAQVIQLLSTFEEDPRQSAGEVRAQTGRLDALDRAPAHLVALSRHVKDLRDGTHGGAESRADKEALFERAVDWLAPVAWDMLEEVNDLLLLSRGELSDSDTQREEDGTLARTWTLSWPEQVERDLAPVTLRAWFGGGFHHPHLRGATVHDWPLNIYSHDDAVGMLPVLRSVVAADLHNLIFQADWRIIPAARADS